MLAVSFDEIYNTTNVQTILTTSRSIAPALQLSSEQFHLKSMDPPPLPSHVTAIPTISQVTIAQQNYQDSACSSPRSHQNDTWDQESLPPVPGAKLRLICSYGGHIIPRPHDKSLCYVSGDTRIVVVDRQSSLSDLHARLSHTLLNGRGFTLKYQLPSEDLDSLVSVTTDEDLENMIEEYDRAMTSSPLKPSRLRLFLFLAKPETAASMGCLLADSKSETWFVDALNNASLLSRGLSDSAAVDNFLEIETIPNSNSGVNLEAQNESLAADNRQMAKNATQEVQSTMSDSPMVETTSSFESGISSPSMPNLPPIKVRAEDGHMNNARFHDQMVGLDDQFSHMNVASNAQRLDDGYLNVAAAAMPPIPTIVGGAAVMSSATLVNTAAPAGEHHGRVISDDEKSDHGAPSVRRKPPLPLQPVQRKIGDGYSLASPDSKHAGGYSLQSPDSVASDSSIASGASFSKHAIYQDAPPATSRETRVPLPVTDPRNNIIMDQNSQFQMPQVQDSVVMQVPQQNQQQQYIPANAHYIQHSATGPVAIPSYYQMYAPPTQQPLHQQMDQQYQMYYVPVPQTQQYNMSVQPNNAEATAAASSQQLTSPNPTTASSPVAFKEALPPIYPAKMVPSSKPEMGANVYRTATPANQTVVQIPSGQYHQQYYGLSQVPPPSQPMVAVSNGAATYGYEYSHPMHDQVFYSQNTAPPHPSQYQTMTPTTAVLYAQASAQLAAENTTAQNRTS